MFDNIKEERVKWFSKKKFACKKNKGEHEYLTPTIKYQPEVRYIYKTKNGILDSYELENEKYLDAEYLYAQISIGLETTCKHCGHKVLSFLREEIK